jgi:hypothetical protein
MTGSQLRKIARDAHRVVETEAGMKLDAIGSDPLSGHSAAPAANLL